MDHGIDHEDVDDSLAQLLRLQPQVEHGQSGGLLAHQLHALFQGTRLPDSRTLP